MGSLWLGAFVGFLVTLIFEWMFPGIGHLVGGLIGGFGGVHGWGVGRGALAGFLAVLFGGIIFARFVFTGFALVGRATSDVLGELFGGLVGLAAEILAIIFDAFGAIGSTIGGLTGGLLAR